MGILFQWEHPEFQRAIQKILISGAKHHLPVGYPADDTAEKALSRLRQGFQFVTTGMDSLLVQRAARDVLEEIKKGWAA